MVTNNPKLYLLVTFIFYYSIAFLKDREIKTYNILSLPWDSNSQSLGLEATESFKHLRNTMLKENCQKRL